MATTIIPGSSWQTIFVATLYKFTKAASDQIIRQLNAAGIRESHASYDMSGNKFKIECLIVDASRAFMTLNRIIKEFVLKDEEKAGRDLDYHPQVARIFASHLEDAGNDDGQFASPMKGSSYPSEEDESEDRTPSPFAIDHFVPKDPRLEQYILFIAPKQSLQASSGCQITRDQDGRGFVIKGATEELVEKVVEQLRLLGRDANRAPVVEHISMARGSNVELKFLKLANLRDEPTFGTILLPPNSPHYNILHKTNILQIHAYNEEAQKHKGLTRRPRKLPSGQDMDIFDLIKFSVNYQPNVELGANDASSTHLNNALNSNVGEWLGTLRAAAEETEAQKDQAPGKILALFDDSDVLGAEIPPPILPSASPNPHPSAQGRAPSPWKFPPGSNVTSQQTSAKNNSAATSASGVSLPKRITKFSETPGPRNDWEVASTQRSGHPVAQGRWGEAVEDHGPASFQPIQPPETFSQSLNTFAQTKTELIDLSEETNPSDGMLPIPPPGFSEPLQPTESQKTKPVEQIATEQVEKEDEITVRRLRRTMRQKAAKKRAGRKSGNTDPRTAAAHAMLKQDAGGILQGHSSSSAQTSPSEGPTRVNSPGGIQRPEAPVDRFKSLRSTAAKFVRAVQNGLKHAQLYPGSISLEIQLGIVIMLDKNIPEDLKSKFPVPSATIIPRLTDIRGFGTMQESFTTAVTAKMGDLTDLLMATGIDATKPYTNPFATYEIICQRADEEYVRVHVDAADPSQKSCMLASQADILACIYMHSPNVVHDARALILGEQKLPIRYSPELKKFVNDLRISMSEHDSTLPTIYGEDYGNLRVKAVLIRSAVIYKVPGKPCLLRVVRVHDLEVSRPQTDENNPGNFNAGPSDKAAMVSAGRVWYELSLELANPPKELSGTEIRGLGENPALDSDRIFDETFIESLTELQNASQEMVQHMKGVGMDNKGPGYMKWKRVVEEREKRGEVESFW